MAEKYRPSNGTEGEWFMDQFCHQCVKCPISPEADNQCKIMLRSLMYNTEDKEYPKQWVYTDEGKPICTAFKSREEYNASRRSKAIRQNYIASDKLTLDMF